MCMVDYAEPCYPYQTRRVAHARKRHLCDECQRSIEAGEPYHYAWMICEGQPCSFATCQHCMSAQAWLVEQCGGYLHGGVQEDLEEHVHELPFTEPGSKVKLLRLIVGMRHRWHRLTDPGQLMAVRAL